MDGGEGIGLTVWQRGLRGGELEEEGRSDARTGIAGAGAAVESEDVESAQSSKTLVRATLPREVEITPCVGFSDDEESSDDEGTR